MAKKNRSLVSKITFFTIILAIILFTISLFYVAYNARDYVREEQYKNIAAQLRTTAEVLERSFSETATDLIFFAKGSSLDYMVNHSKDDVLYQVEKKRLANAFQSKMLLAGRYDQLRYINQLGMEEVRVNYLNGLTGIVSEDELQDKSHAAYVGVSSSLKEGSIQATNVSLNREGENNKIVKPFIPIIRYITPVFNKQKEFKGSLVANIYFNQLLQGAFVPFDKNINFSVIDQDGFYLVHENESKRWGSETDLNTQENFFIDSPDLKNSFNNQFGVFERGDGNIIFHKVFYGGDNQYFMLISESLHDDSIISFLSIFQDNVFILFSAALLVLISFIFSIRYFLKPLGVLTVHAKAISEGDFNNTLSTVSNDEIGILAETLNSVSKNLKISYSQLESNLAKNNISLNQKVNELEQAKKAMINVLDDVEKSRKKAEVQEEKTKAILANIGDGLIVYNKQGEITMVNRFFKKRFDISDIKDVLGKKLIDILNVYDKDKNILDEAGCKKRRMYILEPSPTGEYTPQLFFYQKDGLDSFPVSVTISPIFSDDELIGFVEVFRDITQEMLIDKAKTEFVSLASHQLRTPLTAIRWYVEMLINGDAGDNTELQLEYLGEIETGSLRMIDLVNSLLNVSRVELGNFAIDSRKVNLMENILQITKEFEHTIQSKGIDFVLDIERAPHTYVGDTRLLQMIFQNLLSNAFKYTEKGTVSFVVYQKEDMLKIEVADTGYGIPVHQQDKIFSKLFRADNAKAQDATGTGLGLYIIKAIVEESNGEIWFDSVEGEGTTFHISLPISGMKTRKGSKPLEI